MTIADEPVKSMPQNFLASLTPTATNNDEIYAASEEIMTFYGINLQRRRESGVRMEDSISKSHFQI